jgi:hypothetical protein
MFLGSGKVRGVRSLWLARNCLRVLRLVHCVEYEQLEETLRKLENFERENSDIFFLRGAASTNGLRPGYYFWRCLEHHRKSR